MSSGRELSSASAERSAAEKRRRSAHLSQRRVKARAGREGERYLVLRLGRERYGLPLGAVERVHFLPPLIAIPGVPSYVAGAAVVGGLVLTVLDLGRLFGIAGEHDAARERLVVGAVRSERVGLRVDAIEGVEAFAEIIPLSAERAGNRWLREAHIRGVGKGEILLLDLERVLDDPRLRPAPASPRSLPGASDG